MNIDEALDKVLAKYEVYTDIVIGLAFIREPFWGEFRTFVGLNKDKDAVSGFADFMTIAHSTFRWTEYLEARTTAEKTFRLFYDQMKFPAEKLDEALDAFIVSFFNQCIDESQYRWENAHPDEEYPQDAVTSDDIDNLYFARILSCMRSGDGPEDDAAFCESIGVRYHYEQLHMCCWFSGQITNGAGQYSRDEINYSARTCYNRLLNPYSLLWIAVVMGADREEIKKAAEEMKDKKTNAAKCGTVRKHVPFDVVWAALRSRQF